MHHPTFQNSIIQCQEEYPTLWVPLSGETRERVPQQTSHQGLQQPLLSSWVPTAFTAKESHSISQRGIQLPEPPGLHANSPPPLRCATPTALSPPHAHPSRPGVAIYPTVVSWTQGNPECVSRTDIITCPTCGIRPGAVTHPTQVVPVCPPTSEGLSLLTPVFKVWKR